MPVETYTTPDGEDGVVISNPLDDEGPTLSIERVRGIIYFGVGTFDSTAPVDISNREWTQVDVEELFEGLGLLGLVTTLQAKGHAPPVHVQAEIEDATGRDPRD